MSVLNSGKALRWQGSAKSFCLPPNLIFPADSLSLAKQALKGLYSGSPESEIHFHRKESAKVKQMAYSCRRHCHSSVATSHFRFLSKSMNFRFPVLIQLAMHHSSIYWEQALSHLFQLLIWIPLSKVQPDYSHFCLLPACIWTTASSSLPMFPV